MGNDRMTICRKIKLFPVGDKEEINRVYDFIRNGQYAQYQACNLLMGQLMSEYYKYNRDIKNEEFKARQKEIMTNSNIILKDIDFATGVDTPSAVTQKVKQDFSTALKNGLAKGERTVTNYKRTNPLITRGRNLTFYHEYETYQDFLDKINDCDLTVYVKWVNKIVFKVVFGNPHRSLELRSVIQNILEENYKVQGSSIEIDGKSIILNLSISIPKQLRELDENTVVGVDLGIAVPAMCALNNNFYERLAIGNADDFLKIRTKMQAQRRRLQKSLRNISGGHGRAKKLKALEKLQKAEAHFVETYCHMISKRVVDFALKHNAKYINIENLTGCDTSDFILRNWSYYKLQDYITYKAAKYGIEVRKINPCYTSQICSVCGNWEFGQRKSQSVFECANENCDSHKKYEKIGFNADFNAARNIAMSTLWMESGQVTEKSKQEAREYYDISKKYEQSKSDSENNKVA